MVTTFMPKEENPTVSIYAATVPLPTAAPGRSIMALQIRPTRPIFNSAPERLPISLQK